MKPSYRGQKREDKTWTGTVLGGMGENTQMLSCDNIKNAREKKGRLEGEDLKKK